jgi:catechol 2,3-dioxygenase-like lactoylglutathione lyase family enzyme
MSSSQLPERASLEYLKKLAKERLTELRQTDPTARLNAAQLAVARDHGFASWRALKAEVDRRHSPTEKAFFAACAAGDVSVLRGILDADPALVRELGEHGATGLHLAARHAGAVRLLIERGADPNARDVGDNALAVHFAAGGGHIESVRALLDAGSDVHGAGDLHRMEVIGWATAISGASHREVVDLLVERGARHHVFSAIALGDLDLIQRLIETDPRALGRRMSKFEQEMTALHYVIAPPDGLIGGVFRTGEHYRTLELLIELGAEVDAFDAKGRTPLELAMLRGDQEAMRRLDAAGAKAPVRSESVKTEASQADLGRSIGKLTPSLGVLDMEATIRWYTSIGFKLDSSHENEGKLDWAQVSFGDATVSMSPSTEPTRGLSLWIGTDRIDDLYGRLKQQQLDRARAVLAGETPEIPEVQFAEDLYTAFYGLRQFSIRGSSGVTLVFVQPVE